MRAYPPFAGIILAGGRSRRLGQDKRRLRLWGTDGPTLLEHTVHLLQPLCAELLVVLNDPEHWPQLGCPTIRDRYPDGAALGGLATALELVTLPTALLLAADMPFLDPSLIQSMAAYPRTYDALVLRSPRPAQVRNDLAVEPLHAMYHRHCGPVLQQLLAAGERRFSALFTQVQTHIIDPEPYATHQSLEISLLNINTAADLMQAYRIINKTYKT